MAINFNGIGVTKVIFNGTELTKVINNGTTVFEVQQGKWTYIGTSGSSNGIYATDYYDGTCKTSAGISDMLTAARPPANYSVGYVMRVNHNTYDDWLNPVLCTSYFYRRDA